MLCVFLYWVLAAADRKRNLASQQSQLLGKEYFGRVGFKKVFLFFSNDAIDGNLRTSSLITRTTNDVATNSNGCLWLL